MSNKICVILSGGLDSTVLTYHMVQTRGAENVTAITFNYGQRHSREISFAQRTTAKLQIPHQLVPMEFLGFLLPGSSQTDPTVAVPEGHYEDESMKTTVVPNRNLIMLSIAAGYALAHSISEIAFGAHAGDHAIYPDCRRDFLDAARKTLQLVDYKPVYLLAPFIYQSKADIVRTGLCAGVPFEDCYSCYKGGPVACGVCGTCTERLEAFKLAGVRDPFPYSRL